MKVLCVGLMICDIALKPIPRNIISLDQCDIDTPKLTSGGDALNVAKVLAKLNVETSIVGRVGNDINGDFLIEESTKVGVNTDGVIRDPNYNTALSYILIEESGERHFLCDSKLNDVLTADDISDNVLNQCDIVYFGSALAMNNMDKGGIAKLFKRAHSMGKITALDTSTNIDNIDSRLFEQLSEVLYETDIFIPSFNEAKLLCKSNDINQIEAMFSKYKIKIFGIKLGSNGCYVTNFITRYKISTFNNFKVIDTTGAGDSFFGGFLCGISNGWNLKDSAVFATAVAAFSVSTLGATEGVPSLNIVLSFIKNCRHQLIINESEVNKDILIVNENKN